MPIKISSAMPASRTHLQCRHVRNPDIALQGSAPRCDVDAAGPNTRRSTVTA
jgi:hypothetical protein